jgi:hypothetical protein
MGYTCPRKGDFCFATLISFNALDSGTLDWYKANAVADHQGAEYQGGLSLAGRG